MTKNLQEYLTSLMETRKTSSIRNFFQQLGSEERFGITLRNFNQIIAGERRPNPGLLVKLFTSLEPYERRDLVLSYFKSFLDYSDPDENNFLKYLEECLAPYPERALSEKSKTATPVTRKRLNGEQLRYLSTNKIGLRIFFLLALEEKIELESLTEEETNAAKTLVKLHLAEKTKKLLKASSHSYSIPVRSGANVEDTRMATKISANISELFLSYEAPPTQTIHFRLQWLPEAAVQQVVDRIQALHDWIRSLAMFGDISQQKKVPFVYWAFSKRLERRDFR